MKKKTIQLLMFCLTVYIYSYDDDYDYHLIQWLSGIVATKDVTPVHTILDTTQQIKRTF